MELNNENLFEKGVMNNFLRYSNRDNIMHKPYAEMFLLWKAFLLQPTWIRDGQEHMRGITRCISKLSWISP